MKHNILATMAAGLILGLGTAAAQAAEIKVMSTIGVKPALPDIVAEFERTSGHKVAITWGNASTLKSRYLEGAEADVAILTGAAIDDLAKAGKLGTRVDLCQSGIGLGVKAGAPKPDIATREALKRALLAAKTVGWSTAGASGIYFVTVLDKLGITAEVRPKHKDTSGAVGELIAKGEAEIGVQQIPELAAVPGVDVLGPLPGDLQLITVFSAALDAKAANNEAAKAFLKFISSPAAAAAYKSKGLDPS